MQEFRYWETDRVGRGMERWKRERPDIDCSGKAIVGRVLHLHDIILRATDKALAKHGLKYPTYAVLATLRVNGEPYSMSPSELLATMLLTSGGLSNLLRRMEKDGLIERFADKRDGRGVVVKLTPKGLDLADASMADHAATERELCANLTVDIQKQTAQALSLMVTLSDRK